MSHHIESIKLFLDGVGIFFTLYLIGYSTFLFLSVFTGSATLYRRRYLDELKNVIDDDYYIPISILVPAHDEAVTIVDSVASLVEQDYPLYEIVVVDDGSRDGTAEKLVAAFDLAATARPIRRVIPCGVERTVYEGRVNGVPLTVVSKENGGKADALNMGLNVSRYPYFLCIDADSMLQYDSLRKIALPILEDNRVIACGGQVRVSNGVRLSKGRVTDYRLPKKWLVAMQVLEYDRSFLASRIFMDRFNANLIISGAFGLFQKEIVLLAGGYEPDTMGEDMELAIKLHVFCRANQIAYSMRYAPDAVCWSQAPGTIRDLARQRRRWHIGLFESLWKYRGVVGKKRYGLLGAVSFPYFWLYELLSPYIELFGWVTIALAFLVNLVNRTFMILFFTVYAVYGCTLTLIAFFSRIHTQQISIPFRDCVKAVLLSACELFGMRFLLMLVRMNALTGYRRKRREWGKLRRETLQRD